MRTPVCCSQNMRLEKKNGSYTKYGQKSYVWKCDRCESVVVRFGELNETNKKD